MPRARRIVLASIIAVVSSSLAAAFPQDEAGQRAPAARRGANPPARTAQAAPDPALMEKLLTDWERQSEKLQTLQIAIYRIDRRPAWNEEIHYEGQAVFQSPQFAYLDFKKLKTVRTAKGELVPVADPKDPKKKKRQSTREETIICGQNEVWQYLWPVKQIYVYPLAKEQRQRALDEGPLPFLFNMKAQRAKERYEMKLLGEDQKYYTVAVYPKLPEDKEAFRAAQIVLDKHWFLPVRIVLISPDGKSLKDFRFEDIVANQKVAPVYFKGRPLPGYKLERNPQAQQAANGQGRVDRPVRGLARPR